MFNKSGQTLAPTPPIPDVDVNELMMTRPKFAPWLSRAPKTKFWALPAARGIPQDADSLEALVQVQPKDRESSDAHFQRLLRFSALYKDGKTKPGSADNSTHAPEVSTVIRPRSAPSYSLRVPKPEETRELASLIAQYEFLNKMISRQIVDPWLVSAETGRPIRPSTVLVNGRWTVEGYTGGESVRIECASQEVHIAKCAGIDAICVRIEGTVKSLHIENSCNLTVSADGILFSVSMTDCAGVRLAVGGECPPAALRAADDCRLCLCPDTADGAIETRACRGVAVHAAPRGGLMALTAEEVLRRGLACVEAVPDRVVGRLGHGNVIFEPAQSTGVNTSGALDYWRTLRAEANKPPPLAAAAAARPRSTASYTPSRGPSTPSYSPGPPRIPDRPVPTLVGPDAPSAGSVRFVRWSG